MSTPPEPSPRCAQGSLIRALLGLLASAALAGCGGGGGGTTAEPANAAGELANVSASGLTSKASQRDAARLADQASFGATEGLVADIRSRGAAPWIAEQMALNRSRYGAGGDASVHQNTQAASYCDLPANAGPNCWRDKLSTQPLLWDFYRNALSQPDQLRQRVALALQQLLVVSGLEVEGTYGFRAYHNALLDAAFGNYRALLRAVMLSPVMGDYLNNVNNHKAAPNENFARELLQLFTIGSCDLNNDGTLKTGQCVASYDNATVRNYAYALTGWTYPPGGATAWGCWPSGTNCRFYGGDMVALEAVHDEAERALLSGVRLGAGQKAGAALERVLDSLMAHPSMAPFISRHLIQHLVLANPTPAYVGRVATAFGTGQFRSGTRSFGSGQPGDLAATVAAVLLDAEARAEQPGRSGGKLREPALLFTGVLRALNGQTDGESLGWAWGAELRQQIFRPPSVFNFYAADHPVPGTALSGPSFGIHNANSALQRLNYLVFLLDAGGAGPDPSIPAALGTRVDLSGFLSDAADAGRLVDRLSLVAMGQPMPATARAELVKAVSWWTDTVDKDTWRLNRVRTAAYLVFGSPDYQVQR